MNKYILAAFSALTFAAATAQPPTVITRANVGELTKADTYFIITENVDFGTGQLNLGARSVLQFKGGSIKAGKIVFNNNSVSAPAYRIFITDQFSGPLANGQVPAQWFGNLSQPDQTARTLNTALAAAGNSSVVLGGGTYQLAAGTSIEISRDGAGLKTVGKIVPSSTAPAVVVRGKYQTVDINQISAAQAGTAMVEVDKSLLCSQINLNRCTAPSSVNTAGLAVQPKGTGVFEFKYNRINFQNIKGGSAILYKFGNAAASAACNVFRGGRVQGGRGLDLQGNGAGSINSELFDCIGFEGLNRASVVLNEAENTQITNIRMAESFCRDSVADISQCSNVFMDFKSGVNYPSLRGNGNTDCSANVWIMRGTDAAYDLYFNKLIFTESPTGNALSQFMTNSLRGHSGIASSVSFATDRTLPLSALFGAGSASGANVMTDWCNLTVTNGATLSLTAQRRDYSPPLTVALTLTGGARVLLVNGAGGWLTLDKSGIYRIDQLLLSPTNQGELFQKTVTKL